MLVAAEKRYDLEIAKKLDITELLGDPPVPQALRHFMWNIGIVLQENGKLGTGLKKRLTEKMKLHPDFKRPPLMT